MFSRYDTDHECDRQTDGRTNRIAVAHTVLAWRRTIIRTANISTNKLLVVTAWCAYYASARTRRRRHCVFYVSVRLFVCPSVTKPVNEIFWKRTNRCWYQLAQVAEAWKVQRCRWGGRQSGSHDTEDRFEGLAVVSFSTILGRVAFYSLILLSSSKQK